MALESRLEDSQDNRTSCYMDLEVGDGQNAKSKCTFGALGGGWVYLDGQSYLECDLEARFIFVDCRCSNCVILSKFDLEGYLERILRCFGGGIHRLAKDDLVMDYGLWGRKLQDDEDHSR